MKAAMRMLFVAASLPAVTVAEQARNAVTPLEKVLTMMTDMVKTAKAEKHEEQVEFAKFQAWCDGTRSSTTRSIAEAKTRIEQLSADIAKAKADAEVLAKEIGQLQAALNKASAEFAAAKDVRDKEHADYEAQHKDFSESIEASQRAVEVLKAKSAAVPQSLLQVRSLRRLPMRAKAAIDALLQQAELAAPEANAYEFQSGGVVDMLEKLKLDFEDQRLVLEKAEITAKANYDVLAQQLTDNIKSFNQDVAKKTALKASRQEAAAKATGELESTKTSLAQDEKTLTDTIAECTSSSKTFEKDQGTRADEIKALESAISILSSDEVSLVQASSTAAGSALAHLRSKSSGSEAGRERLVQFLQARASASGSRFLSLAASRAMEDPFAKIKVMISEMLDKLQQEAVSDAEHNGWCTSELAKNGLTREHKSADIEELSAQIDQLTSDSARLASEIAELSASVGDLREARAEATRIRNEEREANKKIIEEAKVAQVAVAKATQVLEDFYGKAKSLELLQGQSLASAMAQATKAPYKGQQSESTGIFGLLEVILSDFARTEAQTASAEDQAQSVYERFLADTDEDLAVKETTIEHKEKAKRTADETAIATKKELDLTQSELDSALEYFEKLKVECGNKVVSYEDKVKARNEEIKSLQEALTMLAQGDFN